MNFLEISEGEKNAAQTTSFPFFLEKNKPEALTNTTQSFI